MRKVEQRGNLPMTMGVAVMDHLMVIDGDSGRQMKLPDGEYVLRVRDGHVFVVTMAAMWGDAKGTA